MINDLKWMFVKNDPSKLSELYKENKPMRERIVERLLELEELDYLIDIAKEDPVFRGKIINDLILSNSLILNQIQEIMKWLPISMLHKNFLNYICEFLSKDDLRKIIDDPATNSVVFKHIRKVLKIDKDDDKNIKSNEDYLKLKMLIEDQTNTGTSEEEPQKSVSNKNHIVEKLHEYLSARKNTSLSEEYKLVKSEIISILNQPDYDLELILYILNLSNLRAEKKIKLIREVNALELIQPKNFQLISEFSELPFEAIKNIFSLTTINEWIKTYLRTSLNTDLIYLYNTHIEFKWLKPLLKNYDIINESGINLEENKCALTNELGFKLLDIVPSKKVKEKLKYTCTNIQRHITNNLLNPDFDIKKYIKILLRIGGQKNIFFVTEILDKRIVDNPQKRVNEIEKEYLSLKTRIDDPVELKELIKNEVMEKNNLIATSTYRNIAGIFFEELKTGYMHSQIKELFINELPDLYKYSDEVGSKGKVLLCKFIGLLEIKEYKDLLEEYADSQDYNVAINAAIALYNLKDKSAAKILKKFAESPNYVVRSLIASSLKNMKGNIDEALVLKLAQDKNLEVVQQTINAITLLPPNRAINIIEKIIPITYYKNRPYIAEALGNMKTPKVLSQLAEILKNGEHDDYLSVIKALSKINHKISIRFIEIINTTNKPILELEKARSLIALGEPSGWDILDKCSNSSNKFISLGAKTSYLKLTSGQRLQKIRELSFDENKLVSILATGRLFIHSETEGWDTINRMIKSSDDSVRYHLTHLLANLPFNKVKKMLFKLFSSGDYTIKTIIANIFAINQIDNYLIQIENSIPKLDIFGRKAIIEGLKVFPSGNCLSIIRKLCLSMDKDIIFNALPLLTKYDIDEVLNLILLLWKKSDIDTKAILASVLINFKSSKIIAFINEKIENQPPEIIAEFAHTLIIQGDDSGWDILTRQLSSNDTKEHKLAVNKLSKIRNNKSYKLLYKYLTGASERMQADIIKAIGKMKIKESFPLFEKYVLSESVKIKLAVAKALGEMKFDKSIELLSMLKKDKDEYVQVSVDIAFQKQKQYTDHEEENIYEDLKLIFRTTSWKLSQEWFDKQFISFSASYTGLPVIKMSDFGDMTIMEENDLENSKAKINRELEKQLIKCVDVEKILEYKEKARRKVNSLVTKEEFINSILNLNPEKLTQEGWQNLMLAVKSKDKKIIRSIILASEKSKHHQWIFILSKIIEDNLHHGHRDLIIFSLFKKMNSQCIPVMVQLCNKERARYYLILMLNYFILYPDQLEASDLEKAKNNIDELDRIVSKSIMLFLNILIENKA